MSKIFNRFLKVFLSENSHDEERMVTKCDRFFSTLFSVFFCLHSQARRQEPTAKRCRVQFFRLKLELTLNIPIKSVFEAKLIDMF